MGNNLYTPTSNSNRYQSCEQIDIDKGFLSLSSPFLRAVRRCPSYFLGNMNHFQIVEKRHLIASRMESLDPSCDSTRSEEQKEEVLKGLMQFMHKSRLYEYV